MIDDGKIPQLVVSAQQFINAYPKPWMWLARDIDTNIWVYKVKPRRGRDGAWDSNVRNSRLRVDTPICVEFESDDWKKCIVKRESVSNG